MQLRRHILTSLFATAISCFVLPSADNCIANELDDDYNATENREVPDHSELSLPTGFWRSEFFNTLEAPEKQGRPDPKNQRSPGGMPRMVQKSTLELSVARLEEEFSQSTATDSDTPLVADIDSSETHAAISDWERAACSAIDRQAGRSTREGPSLITMIVGVVGVVVVFGAYFSSARNA